MKQAALAMILLTACAKQEEVYDCSCVEVPTEEETIAATGFPPALLYMEDTSSIPGKDGLTRLAVQYDATQATPEMVKASPGALCAQAGLRLVSSRITKPRPDDMQIEGSKLIQATCR